MSLYERVADRTLRVEDYDLRRRERETSSGFTRVTTTVELRGEGATGYGEDATYDAADHDALLAADPDFPLSGEHTHREFSALVGDLDLFPEAPGQAAARRYRRWAFESAALDLALKQADTNLGAALGRRYDPVRFVVSTRLGDPPTIDRVRRWRELYPDVEFKLDPTTGWTAALIDRLAATGAVRVLDLKGKYEGTEVDQAADPDLYERVLSGFPEAVVEDPAFTEETRPLFDGHEERVAWDYPISSVENVEDLPFEPAWLNVKPSRFGSVRSLLATIEHCEDRGIACYGGGQFELGVGRAHIHALASLFYPDGPNDIAPRAYNDPEPQAGLPASPLRPDGSPDGLGFEYE